MLRTQFTTCLKDVLNCSRATFPVVVVAEVFSRCILTASRLGGQYERTRPPVLVDKRVHRKDRLRLLPAAGVDKSPVRTHTEETRQDQGLCFAVKVYLFYVLFSNFCFSAYLPLYDRLPISPSLIYLAFSGVFL